MADGARQNPADLTAADLARRIASGEIPAAEAVRACLDRIEAADGDLKAWVHVDHKGAMAAAEALDRHRRSGLPCGPLHGVPVGVKDIIDVAGMMRANGHPLDAGRGARRDAPAVERLRRAGAVIIGKTATTPLAQGAPAAPTQNPHDAGRTPGGSSAGSAAAVAAGMVPLAVGTQTNGSVIRPSSFCGIVGFKPSFGSIPRSGILPVAPSLDHVGLMGRSVEDMAYAGLMMGEDGEDPDCRGFRGPLAAVAASEPPLKPNLALVMGPGEPDPSTRDAFGELTEALGGIGTVPLPSVFGEVFGLTRTLMAAEGAHHLGRYLDEAPDAADPGFCALIEDGRRTTAPDYLSARAMRARVRAAVAEAFDTYDAILTPATPGEAPGRETTGDPSFCTLWSFTGLPAITLPLLTGPAGLPLGVQLVGPMDDDARLLRTARWLVRTLSETGETDR